MKPVRERCFRVLSRVKSGGECMWVTEKGLHLERRESEKEEKIRSERHWG